MEVCTLMVPEPAPQTLLFPIPPCPVHWAGPLCSESPAKAPGLPALLLPGRQQRAGHAPSTLPLAGLASQFPQRRRGRLWDGRCSLS